MASQRYVLLLALMQFLKESFSITDRCHTLVCNNTLYCIPSTPFANFVHFHSVGLFLKLLLLKMSSNFMASETLVY